MSGKMKFMPVVTRIKLNPEQAVLVCSCWNSRRAVSNARGTRRRTGICGASARTYPTYSTTAGSATRS
jgi:hypothetical protein